MSPISVDELPDFLAHEYPGQQLTCIADFTRDAISIQLGGKEIGLFSEGDFEQDKVTQQMIRDCVNSVIGKS